MDGQTLGSGISLDNFAGTLINSSSAAAEVVGTVNATTAASFTVGGSHDITFDGLITGPSSDTLTMSGSGELTLAGGITSVNLAVNSGTV